MQAWRVRREKKRTNRKVEEAYQLGLNENLTSYNNDCTVTHPSDASPKCLNKLLDNGDMFISYIKEHQNSDLYIKLFKHFVQS